MGQIAACLTDLICLIEQRDAFGFTSPSKAAESASVKKERGEKRREKNPLTPFPLQKTSTNTANCSFLEGLFLRFKHLIHCPPTQSIQVISFWQKLQAWKICQLSVALMRSRTLGWRVFIEAKCLRAIKGRVWRICSYYCCIFRLNSKGCGITELYIHLLMLHELIVGL